MDELLDWTAALEDGLAWLVSFILGSKRRAIE